MHNPAVEICRLEWIHRVWNEPETAGHNWDYIAAGMAMLWMLARDDGETLTGISRLDVGYA